jgi:hypothetical protein
MRTPAYLPLLFVAIVLAGCVSTGGTAIETHQKGLKGLTEDDYVPAKKPIDRHFIGAAWSKQFGPIDEPGAEEIRVRKERSFSNVQQDYAYNLGIALGATPTALPARGEFGAQGSSIEKSKLEGLEVIMPVSLADIPFEPDTLFVTEALRLANFKIKAEKENIVNLSAGAGNVLGRANAAADAGSQGRRATEGEGLVVAYKLKKIDSRSYEKKETNSMPLQLEQPLDLQAANLVVKAGLLTIEPGSGKSLPRNILWACPRADAQSKNVVAAWIVDIKSTDPKRKSLTIGFPALPKIDDCQGISRAIVSRIDPRTDRIVRQKLNLVLLDAEVTDFLQPKSFDARLTLIDESFKLQDIGPSDL